MASTSIPRTAFRSVVDEHAERPLSPEQLVVLRRMWDDTADVRNAKERYACRFLRSTEEREDRVQTYHLLAWKAFVGMTLRGRSPLSAIGTLYSLAAQATLLESRERADPLCYRAGPHAGLPAVWPHRVPLYVPAPRQKGTASVIDGQATRIGRPFTGPSGESCDPARRAAFRLDWLSFLASRERFTRIVIHACMTGDTNTEIGAAVGISKDTVAYHRRNVRRWLADQTAE